MNSLCGTVPGMHVGRHLTCNDGRRVHAEVVADGLGIQPTLLAENGCVDDSRRQHHMVRHDADSMPHLSGVGFDGRSFDPFRSSTSHEDFVDGNAGVAGTARSQELGNAPTVGGEFGAIWTPVDTPA